MQSQTLNQAMSASPTPILLRNHQDALSRSIGTAASLQIYLGDDSVFSGALRSLCDKPNLKDQSLRLLSGWTSYIDIAASFSKGTNYAQLTRDLTIMITAPQDGLPEGLHSRYRTHARELHESLTRFSDTIDTFLGDLNHHTIHDTETLAPGLYALRARLPNVVEHSPSAVRTTPWSTKLSEVRAHSRAALGTYVHSATAVREETLRWAVEREAEAAAWLSAHFSRAFRIAAVNSAP